MRTREKERLFERARQGDATLLLHPRVARVRDETGATPLHILAETGCVRVLQHSEVATVVDGGNGNAHGRDQVARLKLLRAKKETPLHRLASTGCVAVLAHPECASVLDKKRRTPLHVLARTGCVDVLEHPEVARGENIVGWTPLHELASSCSAADCKTVLAHPLVATARGDEGETPLHVLAQRGFALVAEHPEATTVKDFWHNKTPFEFLLRQVRQGIER